MKKQKLTGIRLMARELGVSTATISRALSPDTAHMVKEERRKQILELADKMRYRPNPGARLIQRGAHPVISVLVPAEEGVFFSEFYGRFLAGVIRATSDTDIEIRISALKREPEDILDGFREVGLGCTGLVYAGLPLNAGQLEALSGYHGPLVLLSSVFPPDCPLRAEGFHILGVDNYAGAVAAMEHILELGHRRIGVALGPGESRDFAERERGYRDALERAGVCLPPEMFFTGSYDQESGREACSYFLQQREMPTALVCASDSMAFGALDHAKENGLQCPDNISIIGYDDGPWARACSPQLTTIRQPLGRLAEAAVELLVESFKNPGDYTRRSIELPTVLNVRKSTAS